MRHLFLFTIHSVYNKKIFNKRSAKPYFPQFADLAVTHFCRSSKNYWESTYQKTLRRKWMDLAILGTGNVGSALGKQWSSKGHNILFGSREPGSAKVQALLKTAGGNCRALSFSEAAASTAIILLAVPFHVAQTTISETGNLAGKILIDATNPLGEGMKLITWPDSSGAEQVAQWAPGSKVVKAFNMTGSGNMSDANYGGVKPAMLLCGDDPQARKSVAQLAEEIGFDVVDCGPLSSARYLEAAAGLWVNLAYVQGLGSNIAFALLRR
jgi:NADPH-dependent F420 reductase